MGLRGNASMLFFWWIPRYLNLYMKNINLQSLDKKFTHKFIRVLSISIKERLKVCAKISHG